MIDYHMSSFYQLSTKEKGGYLFTCSSLHSNKVKIHFLPVILLEDKEDQTEKKNQEKI